MHDPYLYEDVPVLINKLGIKDQNLLDNAEADYVVYRLKDLALNPLSGDYHTPHLLSMHEYIFQDIFEWAGQPRTISIYKEEDILGGQSIEYSDPFDIMHDLHHVLSDMRVKKWRDMGRTMLATEFCDSFAKLWKIHPFREGNTRTTVTFCCQFADEMGFPINRKLFEENSRYVRTALGAYVRYLGELVG
jgi:cell filamentation protein